MILLQRMFRPSSSVVAVGWSTGATLAMTLAFTAPARNIKPPDAILAFYCPTDYQAPFWREPNFPDGTSKADAQSEYDLLEGVQSSEVEFCLPSSPDTPVRSSWNSSPAFAITSCYADLSPM